MAKILLVEDDEMLGQIITEALKVEGYVVDWETDGDMGSQMLKSYKYDLVILDWELPTMCGPEICREFRDRGGKAPILFLTHRQNISDKDIGFSSGGDDYLTKPFHIKELQMRIRALLRRPKDLFEDEHEVGPMRLNAANHKFYISGEEVSLSKIEFALMDFFMRNVGVVFSSEAILDRVWPAESTRSPDTLRTCIQRLRKKISIPGKDSVIVTVHGVGYKFEV